MSNRFNINAFQDRIKPREQEEIQESAKSRFSVADETMGSNADEKPKKAAKKKEKEVVCNKLYAFSQRDIDSLEMIKDKLMDERIGAKDIEVVRIMYSLALDADSEALADYYYKITGKKPRKRVGS